MQINNNNKLPFGLSGPTHASVTKLALADFPKLKGMEELIIKYSKMPDFDEVGPLRNFGNWHYFGFHKKNSFENYIVHIIEMLKAHKKGNKELMAEHAGRALHFLQDIAQRQHNEPRSFFKRTPFIFSHGTYELYVQGKRSSFLKPTAKTLEKPRSYIGLYFDNLYAAAKDKRPGFTNILSTWNKTAKNGLALALKSSKEFLANVEAMIN